MFIQLSRFMLSVSHPIYKLRTQNAQSFFLYNKFLLRTGLLQIDAADRYIVILTI